MMRHASEKQIRHSLFCCCVLCGLLSGAGAPALEAEEWLSSIEATRLATRYAGDGRADEVLALIDSITGRVVKQYGLGSFQHQQCLAMRGSLQRVAQLSEQERKRFRAANTELAAADRAFGDEYDVLAACRGYWRAHLVLAELLGSDDSLAVSALLRSLVLDESFGEQEEAVETVAWASDVCKKLLGEQNHVHAGLLVLEGRVRLKRGELKKSERAYRAAEEILKVGVHTADLLKCREEFAATLIACGRFGEAEALARGVVESATERSEPPSVLTTFEPAKLAAARYQLARSLRGLGRLEEAAEEMQQAVSVLDSLKKSPPALHLDAVREYSVILKELGRRTEAGDQERKLPRLEKAVKEQYRLAGLPRELQSVLPEAATPDATEAAPPKR